MAHGNVQFFATPRRLAVRIDDVENQQIDQHISRRGPALSVGRDKNGEPTQALIGFAKSCGVTVEDLITVETDKGVELFFRPNIEAKIYHTLPHYLPKLRGKLKVPAFYIGGTNSHEARMARLGFMKKHFPIKFQFIEGTHLFPFEKPQETAEIIKDIFFKNLFTAETPGR